MHPTDTSQDMDINMVEVWIRKDPKRWIAGVLAGIFSGLVAMGVGGILAVMTGKEFLFPVKAAALPLIGGYATEYGFNAGAIAAGLFFVALVGGFWGFVYSHFVYTNKTSSLLAMGLVWGTFAWIFIANLFIQSFPAFLHARISQGAMFPVMIAYGLSLVSVRFFDKIIKG